MTTLRDALSEALGKSEAGTLESPVETAIETTVPETVVETAEQKEARQRDERGRFAAKAEEKPVLEQPTPTPEARKPPSSWKKDYWGHWERLGSDPELKTLQDYIEQREQDYAKGVSTYKSQWDQAAPIYEAVQPFLPELQQYGISPQNWINNLGAAHRTLALGTPEQKMQMFAKLATDYGIPLQALQALQGGQVDPQFGHITQTVSGLQREVQSLKEQREQAEQTRLQQDIEAFKKNATHFEAVKPTMAQLLQSGVARDLPTAYEKAIRLHDDIWQQEQARQASEAQAKRQAEIEQKKAAAVSPRSSSPTGMATAGGGKKGLRDQLSDAFESVEGGRF